METKELKPSITPDLKVGDLLNAYPELEEELIRLAPVFKKLRNPILRRTVATVTSLRQAAKVGGISLGEMINQLRTAAGMDALPLHDQSTESSPSPRPEWLENCHSIETYDAREDIESGGMPLSRVIKTLGSLDQGQALAVITPFVPAPMIDNFKQKGLDSWTEQKGREHFTPISAPYPRNGNRRYPKMGRQPALLHRCPF